MIVEITHTEFSEATSENVWKLWSDVGTWSQWDHGLEWCKMKKGHKFQLNGEASLLPKGSPQQVDIRIIECTPNKSFTDTATFELGILVAFHEIIPHKNGVNIKHTLSFTPANPQMKAIFEKNMLPKLKVGLPNSVKTLAKMAENQ